MSHVAMTGARGFLGWHTQSALTLRGVDTRPISVGSGYVDMEAVTSLNGASRAIHLAGVNRASDEEVHDGNILFAQQLAAALRTVATPPPVIVYSNSTQAGSESPYGVAKQEAAVILAEAARDIGAEFVDLRLPNLFGEHGRPFYNSVVATFCKLLATGGSPTVEVDRELSLLHAQDAADLLIGPVVDSSLFEEHITVRGLLARLEGIDVSYENGDFPAPVSRLDGNLLNTFRSYVFDEGIRLQGDLGEAPVVSVLGHGESVSGAAQRRGFERIGVQAGRALVSMRRLVTNEVVNVVVDSHDGVTVDLPTMWNHVITNVGDGGLILERSSLKIPGQES